MNGVALSCDAAKASEVVAAARERGLLLNTAVGRCCVSSRRWW